MAKQSSRVATLFVVLLVLGVESARALDHEKGDLFLSWDNTLSYGLRWRTEGRDSAIIGVSNGGEAFSVNGDDGNLNYDTGVVNNALKLISEFEVRYRGYGGFFRVRALYDYENEEGTRARTPLSDEAKDLVGTRLDLLDAYAWARFDLGRRGSAELRLGQQVINWGESTFIPGGINAINAIDLAALRVPGAELRDVLLPEAYLWTSIDTSSNTSVEAFYQFRWNETEIDPPGTYFSTSDAAGAGGERIMLGFGAVPDDLPPGPMPPPIGPVGAVVPRLEGVKASDSGQYGLAFRWFVPRLGRTELGFYFLSYHSRLPILNTRTGTLAGLQGGDYAGSGGYFFSYPEEIKLYGLSFNTQIGNSGVALQGEVSRRGDAPLQADDVEVIYAFLSPLALVGSPVGILLAETNQIGAFDFDEVVPGVVRLDVTEARVTASKFFGRALGADQTILLLEAGLTCVHGMPDKNELRLDGPGTYTSGNPVHETAGVQPGTEPSDRFADSTSWGYRFAGSAEYNRAIGAVNLIPRFYWAHDVNGISPGPGGAFNEGTKSLTLAVGFDYQATWSGEIGYTSYFGAGRYNLVNDRDFVSLEIEYAF